jgi:hypothetical protein
VNEDWDFYALPVDDQPASIFVDLALASRVPITGTAVMVYVSVKMRAPRPDGLSSLEEFDELIAVERSLEAAVKDEERAIYAGRCTAAGYRDFYFYTADAKVLTVATERAMAEHPNYAFMTDHRDDQEWSVYRDFLHPNAREMQRIQNRRVVDLLEHEGDSLDGPRWIDHRAYVATRAVADALRSQLLVQGFSVSSEPSTDDEGIAVDFKRIDRPSEIEAVVLPLFDLVASLGGTYDGWGCEVERGDG